MKDYLILKDLLGYLTYDNIIEKDRECQGKALIRDNAIEFIVATHTLTLIENPLTGESFTMDSDEPDYEVKLNMAKENKWQIWHDNNDTIVKNIKSTVSPFAAEAMCYYKDVELPQYLESQVFIIKEKLQAILIGIEPLKEKGFIQYLKGELQNKINGESELLEKFPCIKDSIIQIQNYLISYWNIDLKLKFPTIEELPLSNDESTDNVEQLGFEPKQFVKRPLLYDIYGILVDNRVLGYKNSREDFYDALTVPSSNVKIQFNCQNSIAINILKLLKKLFFNLTPKAIQESNIFYTSGGTNIKSGDYYRFNTMNPKQKEKFEKIEAELKPLIDKAEESEK